MQAQYDNDHNHLLPQRINNIHWSQNDIVKKSYCYYSDLHKSISIKPLQYILPYISQTEKKKKNENIHNFENVICLLSQSTLNIGTLYS